MLKEFKIKNFRSFRDEEIFSLEAMDRQEDLDCFNIAEIGKEKILKSAAIYGHNSFGKSNLFKGFSKMLQIIRKCSNTNYELSVDNFKLNDFNENEPTKFEVTFFIKEITYRYGFEILNGLINREWLFRKNIRESRIFERLNSCNSSITVSSTYKTLEKYKKFTRDNELFLSSMEKNNITDEIKEICDFLRKKIHIISGERLETVITSEMILQKNIEKSQILKALKSADLGIHNFDVKEEEQKIEDLPEVIKILLKNNIEKDLNDKKIYSTREEFEHSIFSKENKKIGNRAFDIDDFESEGTKKLYSIIGPILDTINKGDILFIDELDSKLHHLIVKYVIDLFNNDTINKKNAQLIFTTHDFYLLKEDIFRKDQIYFIDKNKYGVSSLYSLGDFKNIENKTNTIAHYLLGHFGAIGNINGLWEEKVEN